MDSNGNTIASWTAIRRKLSLASFGVYVVTSKDAASSRCVESCEERVAFFKEACVRQVFENSIDVVCKSKRAQVTGDGSAARHAFAMALVF